MASKLNVKQCYLCPGNTEYYCHSCQKDLFRHCEAVHVIDLVTKHHEVTIYRKKQLSKMNIKPCCLCPGFTEYYCHTCQKDLCRHCKAVHVIDLVTKQHEVTIYREKFKYLLKREKCTIHRHCFHDRYCEPCKVSVCDSCSDHEPHGFHFLDCFYPKKENKHKILGIKTVHQTMRQTHVYWIHYVRSETLYIRRCQLQRLKTKVNKCQKEIGRVHSEMIVRSQALKNLMDSVINNLMLRVRKKHSYLIQKNKITQYIARIQNYVLRFEKTANRPVKFLRFVKTAQLLSMQDTPHITQHYMTSLLQEINIEDLIKILTDIKIIGRPIGDDPLLTLMSSLVLQKSVDCFLYFPKHLYHISSSVTSNQVWVSNDCECKLFIKTETGEFTECVYITDFLKNSSFGIHTLNRDNELIYIDEKLNIKKISSDLLTSESLIDMTDFVWKPKCVYCSLSSGDLIVGMRHNDANTGKIMRYNNTGRHTQTIPHNSITHNLYRFPIFITENNNEDVVVADSNRAVVVTSRAGVHRFSYKGPPSSGSGLFYPRGICTNVLSHILVCDEHDDSVHILDKDGQFLRYLLTQQSLGMYKPNCLSYDTHTHCLWVGSESERDGLGGDCQLSVYSHINRNFTLIDDAERRTIPPYKSYRTPDT